MSNLTSGLSLDSPLSTFAQRKPRGGSEVADSFASFAKIFEQHTDQSRKSVTTSNLEREAESRSAARRELPVERRETTPVRERQSVSRPVADDRPRADKAEQPERPTTRQRTEPRAQEEVVVAEAKGERPSSREEEKDDPMLNSDAEGQSVGEPGANEVSDSSPGTDTVAEEVNTVLLAEGYMVNSEDILQDLEPQSSEPVASGDEEVAAPLDGLPVLEFDEVHGDVVVEGELGSAIQPKQDLPEGPDVGPDSGQNSVSGPVSTSMSPQELLTDLTEEEPEVTIVDPAVLVEPQKGTEKISKPEEDRDLEEKLVTDDEADDLLVMNPASTIAVPHRQAEGASVENARPLAESRLSTSPQITNGSFHSNSFVQTDSGQGTNTGMNQQFSGQNMGQQAQNLQALTGQGEQTLQQGGKAGDSFESLMNNLENKGLKVSSAPVDQRAQLASGKDFSALKPYTTSLPTPMNQSEWSDEFVDKMKWLTSKNIRAAEIHVRPAELGPIEIKIHLNHDQASISFNSQHAQVRDLLELNVHRLRDMLDSSGVNLAEVSVSDQSAGDSSASGRESDEAGASGQGVGSEEAMTSEVASAELKVAPTSLVDTFV